MTAAAEKRRDSVDPAELANFAAIAEEWWDPHGKFRPLHKFNPTRLAYIRDRLCNHFGRDPKAPRPLEGLRLLDVGCGGGLLSEPMHRLGADVTGIDASDKVVSVARHHADDMGLDIDYRVATAEDLAAKGEEFDVVLSMEVVEHVADVDGFLATLGDITAPGGAVFCATINRTPKAFALAIVGAEYVLRWLPRGTHQWQKFVRPSELAAGLRTGGVTVGEITGVIYNPISDRWRLGDDLGVNYMTFGSKASA